VVAAVALLIIVLVLNPFSGTPAGSGTSGAVFGAFVQPGPRTGPIAVRRSSRSDR